MQTSGSIQGSTSDNYDMLQEIRTPGTFEAEMKAFVWIPVPELLAMNTAYTNWIQADLIFGTYTE
jgi:hypothetical protein